MQGGGSAPQFNAGQSIQQQTQSNMGTGLANAIMNNTNQVTPTGSLNYSQTGGQDVNGTFVPQFTATQSLSPEQQGIYNQSTALQSGVLNAAGGLLPRLTNTLNTPLSFDGLQQLPTDQSAFRNQAYGALIDRGTTDINRAQGNSDVQLANQGIAPGSEAATRANDQFSRARNDLSNQSLLQAGNLAGQNLQQAQTIRNQGISEVEALRNQPLADYQALLGLGGGVSSPNFVNTPQTQIQPTDVNGANAIAFQGQTNAYNQQLGQQNALMGGLFGLAGSAARAAPFFFASDARVKENIEPVGETYDGQNLYSYNYKGSPIPQVGLIAQEVEKRDPGAVATLPSGVKAVNYDRALFGAKRGLFGFGEP